MATDVYYSFQVETETNGESRSSNITLLDGDTLSWIEGTVIEAVANTFCDGSIGKIDGCVLAVSVGELADFQYACNQPKNSCEVYRDSIRVVHTDKCGWSDVKMSALKYISETIGSVGFLDSLKQNSDATVTRIGVLQESENDEQNSQSVQSKSFSSGGINSAGISVLLLTGLVAMVAMLFLLARRRRSGIYKQKSKSKIVEDLNSTFVTQSEEDSNILNPLGSDSLSTPYALPSRPKNKNSFQTSFNTPILHVSRSEESAKTKHVEFAENLCSFSDQSGEEDESLVFNTLSTEELNVPGVPTSLDLVREQSYENQEVQYDELLHGQIGFVRHCKPKRISWGWHKKSRGSSVSL
jgi:hypothetical protein